MNRFQATALAYVLYEYTTGSLLRREGNEIPAIQCMYAPEFTAQGEDVRVNVAEEGETASVARLLTNVLSISLQFNTSEYLCLHEMKTM